MEEDLERGHILRTSENAIANSLFNKMAIETGYPSGVNLAFSTSSYQYRRNLDDVEDRVGFVRKVFGIICF